ncbi:unnamed protein product [Moneuplotes crassus]|uniref:Uncharacterized protein n=1 Tax=Euplotes crassus TaxID=5936 RepID=A0AAD1UAL7_EUPCR|nr:unnamed protein product [Moneuplotes crassus]
MAKYLFNIYQGVKSLDMFSQKFTMSFNNKKNYQTFIGAVFSIILVTITSLYAARLLQEMFGRTRLQNNYSIEKANYKENPLNVNLNEEGIYLAFQWVSPDETVDFFGSGIGKIYLHSVNFDASTSNMTEEFLLSNATSEIVKCNDTSFPISKVEGSSDISSQDLYCFKNTSLMKISHGSQSNLKFNNIGIYARSCSYLECPGNYSEIVGSLSYLKIYIISKAIDSSDPTNPVKSYYTDPFILEMSLTMSSYFLYQMQKTQYKVNDWDSLITGGTEGAYYDLLFDRNSDFAPTYTSTASYLEFTAGDNYEIVEINVIGFMDVLGLIGGLYEVLSICFGLVTKIISMILIKRELKKIQTQVNTTKQWFSFNSSGLKPVKKRRKKCVRNTNRVEAVQVSSQRENPNNDRSQLYNMQPHERHRNNIVSSIPTIKDIQKKRRYHQIQQGVDIVDISQSLHELKLYVSYLLDKDNSLTEPPEDEAPEPPLKSEVECIEESKEMLNPPLITKPRTRFAQMMVQKRKRLTLNNANLSRKKTLGLKPN